jgi:aspartate/methionine/tyrosine aminotransferase
VPTIRCIDAGDGGEEVGAWGGGLHLAVDVTGLGLTADEVADVVLEEAEVCVAAVSDGEQHLIRLCLAAEEVTLKASIREVAVCLMALARDMAVE